jgi:O-antigen ligase
VLRAVAWEIAQENWVLGLGIGNGAYEIGHRTNRTTMFYAHNMFMNVAADMGITGLAAFVLMIAAAYLGALVALLRSSRPLDRGLCATAIAALTSWVTFGITLNMEYQNYGYCLLALAFIVPTLLDRPAAVVVPDALAARRRALSAEAS